MVSQGSVDSRTPRDGGVRSKLDRLQSELHEGPCITAIEKPPADGLVVADDLSNGDGKRCGRDSRRRQWTQGYRAMLGVQLSQQPEMQAALNLYGSQPRVFDEHAQDELPSQFVRVAGRGVALRGRADPSAAGRDWEPGGD